MKTAQDRATDLARRIGASPRHMPPWSYYVEAIEQAQADARRAALEEARKAAKDESVFWHRTDGDMYAVNACEAVENRIRALLDSPAVGT